MTCASSCHELASSSRALKANQVPVRISHEELTNPCFLRAIHAIPLRLRLHEKRHTGVAQNAHDGVDLSDADLKIDPPAEGLDKVARQPVPSNATLLEHDVRTPPRDVCEPLLGPLVRDLETAQSAPETDACADIGDEKLGNEIGLKITRSHRTIMPELPAAYPGQQYRSARFVSLRALNDRVWRSHVEPELHRVTSVLAVSDRNRD